ncbi:MAG: hypothetical protein KA436_09790 [Oligoflexales bacterium]|nr:hypothetical protein [Oligoflexales bacterium]
MIKSFQMTKRTEIACERRRRAYYLIITVALFFSLSRVVRAAEKTNYLEKEYEIVGAFISDSADKKSIVVLRDKVHRDTSVLSEGDFLKHSSSTKVQSITKGRIVFENSGFTEELFYGGMTKQEFQSSDEVTQFLEDDSDDDASDTQEGELLFGAAKSKADANRAQRARASEKFFTFGKINPASYSLKVEDIKVKNYNWGEISNDIVVQEPETEPAGGQLDMTTVTGAEGQTDSLGTSVGEQVDSPGASE